MIPRGWRRRASEGMRLRGSERGPQKFRNTFRRSLAKHRIDELPRPDRLESHVLQRAEHLACDLEPRRPEGCAVGRPVTVAKDESLARAPVDAELFAVHSPMMSAAQHREPLRMMAVSP